MKRTPKPQVLVGVARRKGDVCKGWTYGMTDVPACLNLSCWHPSPTGWPRELGPASEGPGHSGLWAHIQTETGPSFLLCHRTQPAQLFSKLLPVPSGCHEVWLPLASPDKNPAVAPGDTGLLWFVPTLHAPDLRYTGVDYGLSTTTLPA